MQSPESAAGTTYAHLTALVMDDDPIFQEWLAICLRDLGVTRQYKAASGCAALDLLSRAECGIDLVICDLDMPEMDGMEFLRHMALSGSHAATQPSLLSARSIPASCAALKSWPVQAV